MDEAIWQWEVVAPGGEDDRCSAFLVRRRDGSVPTLRVLKVLKAPHRENGWRRMAHEAAALGAFCHPRIPRLVESNAHRHAEAAAGFAPYLVTEYVPGAALEHAVRQGGAFPPDVAVGLAVNLLDAVEHCHDQGRVHGDIRPDNILLRGGEPSDPVLIDFHHTLKRRRDGSRGDERIDLTYVSRILLYALTGVFDVAIRDWEGRPPHRHLRKHPARSAGGQDEPARRLVALLDRAFEVEVQDRFQTAGELRAALRAVPRPAG